MNCMELRCPGSAFTLHFARLFLSFVLLAWAGASVAGAANYYVRPPGTTSTVSSPYDSWTTAATQIQWAVDVAMTNLPSTVWVTNGSYCVTSQVMITNFITVRSVTGWTNTLVYADWPAYTTRVFYVVNTGVLDGFSISNGHWWGDAALGNPTNLGGGGAYIAMSATVQNCYFTYNYCSNVCDADGKSGGGGGAYVATGTIQNCYFVTNVAIRGDGGGLYAGPQSVINNSFFTRNNCGMPDIYYRVGAGAALKGRSSASSIQFNNCTVVSNYNQFQAGGVEAECCVISNCLIAFNTAGGAGGGLRQIGPVYMIDCVVSNNTGSDVGGMYVLNYNRYVNCRIVNNYGKSTYGALWMQGGLMTNCIIAGNRGKKIGGVGATANSYNPIILDSCRISNNLAYDASNAGGAGGVLVTNEGYLRNCIIMNNTNLTLAPNAGGVYMSGSGAACAGAYRQTMVNCTIVDNYSSNGVGGLFVIGATNYISNDIIWGNRSSVVLDPDVFNSAENAGSISNCCSGSSLPPSQQNITNDPAFVTGWRLNSSSPCVNAGINQSWMTNAIDLDGGARIRYGRVDMGAYEVIYNGSVYAVR